MTNVLIFSKFLLIYTFTKLKKQKEGNRVMKNDVLMTSQLGFISFYSVALVDNWTAIKL